MRKSLDYLGFTIQGSTGLVSVGIKPSIKKIEVVTNWETPKNVRHSQIFIEGLLETIPSLLPLYQD
jgi:hypothetical protein